MDGNKGSGPIDKHVDMRQSPLQISFDFPPSPRILAQQAVSPLATHRDSEHTI